MDNIYVSDVYVNVRMFRKFIGVRDVTIVHANNSVQALSILRRFIFLYYILHVQWQHPRPLDAKVRGSTPVRAEIWIEFSAPCAPLFRLWGHSIGYQSQSQAWKLT